MGNFIIIDNTANHRNCYTDALGEEWNIDNISHADFFPTKEAAQIFLDDWCLKDDGTGTEWAEILDADAHGLLSAMLTMQVTVVTAYRVNGIHDDEAGADLLYIGADKSTADHVLETATRSHKRGDLHTFVFTLLPTESMPDGHVEWMDRWSEGEIIA